MWGTGVCGYMFTNMWDGICIHTQRQSAKYRPWAMHSTQQWSTQNPQLVNDLQLIPSRVHGKQFSISTLLNGGPIAPLEPWDIWREPQIHLFMFDSAKSLPYLTGALGLWELLLKVLRPKERLRTAVLYFQPLAREGFLKGGYDFWSFFQFWKKLLMVLKGPSDQKVADFSFVLHRGHENPVQNNGTSICTKGWWVPRFVIGVKRQLCTQQTVHIRRNKQTNRVLSIISTNIACLPNPRYGIWGILQCV